MHNIKIFFNVEVRNNQQQLAQKVLLNDCLGMWLSYYVK